MAVKKTTKKDEKKNARVAPEGLTAAKIPPATAGQPAQKFASLNEALFYFQGICPIIPRNGEGKSFDGRPYKYATLDDVISVTKPLLQAAGLMITQPMSGNELVTKLIHASTGQELVSTLPLGNPERSQDLGSRITYLRRYQISSMLGLSLEPDTDAKPTTGLAAGAMPLNAQVKPLPNDIGQTIEMTPEQKQQLARTEGMMVPSQTNTMPRSEPFMKANAAIDSCMGFDALALIRANIGKSVKLNDDEKAELIMFLESKEHALHA